ncbi:MAG: hypothetical protein E2579_25930 [Pseudomonas sp.]|uniref:hypothetical protein n=1 Tax=Ectopseudomonas guguanensis TaxID=1198456 RepID=UPI0012D628DC|nr:MULTISPECIES: hypothetical protein [Pseudomonas]MPT21135.1 hypothetical protein [Pseudomonas sp.]WJH56528.1 hypothetical protein FE254_10215 [Pseudomonas guguanensis]
MGMDGRIGLVEIVLKLRTQLGVMLLVFAISMIVFAVLTFNKSELLEYRTVFEVGARDLDAPLERPDLILEEIQEVYLPQMSESYGGLSISVYNMLGSNLIRLVTKANDADGEKVKRMHGKILERLLEDHSARLMKLETAYKAERAALVKLLDASEVGGDPLRRAHWQHALMTAERRLANLAPSTTHIVAGPAKEPVDFGWGSRIAAAVVFSTLLAVLAGGLGLFIQAVRLRARDSLMSN